MNKLVTVGMVGAAAYGLFNLLRMKNVADETRVTVQKPRVHKVDFGGLTLRADALINNPTKDTMNLTKPVVTLTSNGNIVSMSKAENTLAQIKPLGQTVIDSVELTIPWLTLVPFISGIVGKVPSIIEAVKNKNFSIGKILDIPLEITVSTYADNIFVKSSPIKLT